MNRKAIRDLASVELGIKTAAYRYATTESELSEAIKVIGLPCVIKPLMSSSGKGQSYIRHEHEIARAWQQAVTKGRGDLEEVIVEAFIPFESEITLLTVTQDKGPVLFCPPIGHRQERGDYMESWQPAVVNPSHLLKAQQMAASITTNLTGSGIWGVEFFLTRDDVYFSELSPRPHDTGMVTLAGTQEFNEFELHARAVLGLPVPGISLVRNGASAVILAGDENSRFPEFTGLEQACSVAGSDVRIFGKPATRKYRRMGVALAYDAPGSSLDALRIKAAGVAGMIKINEQKEVAGMP
jgi:phosphoribosylglycinamide formyltransferase 2